MGKLDLSAQHKEEAGDGALTQKLLTSDLLVPSATYQIPTRKAQKLFMPRGQTYFGQTKDSKLLALSKPLWDEKDANASKSNGFLQSTFYGSSNRAQSPEQQTQATDSQPNTTFYQT